MSTYCHNGNDYASGKSPKTWGIKKPRFLAGHLVGFLSVSWRWRVIAAGALVLGWS
jgi:hypothetical protein